MNSTNLNVIDAASYMGIAAGTLNYWRATGSQLVPYRKVGGRVIYRREDLDEWLSHRVFLIPANTQPNKNPHLRQSRNGLFFWLPELNQHY